MEGGRAQRERTHPHWNVFSSNKHQITARLYIILVMGFHALSALLTNELPSVIEGLFFLDFLDVWAVKSLKGTLVAQRRGECFKQTNNDTHKQAKPMAQIDNRNRNN